MHTNTLAVPVHPACGMLAVLLLITTMLLPAPPAAAQVLQDLDAKLRDDGAVDLYIRLAAPARYLRHFPADRGDIVHVYLRLTSLDGLARTPDIPEYRVLLARDGIPRVSVELVDPDADNVDSRVLHFIAQFERPVGFDIRDNPDGREVVMRIQPVQTPAAPTSSAPAPAP